MVVRRERVLRRIIGQVQACRDHLQAMFPKGQNRSLEVVIAKTKNDLWFGTANAFSSLLQCAGYVGRPDADALQLMYSAHCGVGGDRAGGTRSVNATLVVRVAIRFGRVRDRLTRVMKVRRAARRVSDRFGLKDSRVCRARGAA